MKMSLPRTKMLDEAKQSKGHFIIVEILIFAAVFFIGTILEGIVVIVPEMTYLFNNEEYLAIMNQFAQGEISKEELTAQVTALSMNLPDYITIISLAATVLATISCMIYCRFIEKRKLSSMGFRKNNALIEYLVGALVGVVIFSVAVGICLVTGALRFDGISANINWGILGLFFVGFLIQGMSEETLCRGYFMISMSRRVPVAVAVAVSSIVFACLHLSNNGIAPLAFINLVLFGLFAAVYMLKRGNIWGVCAIHSLWNFVQGNLYGISVSGMSKFETIFNMSSVNSKELWNGGSFGLEGGLAVTFVLTVGIAAMLFTKTKPSELAEENPSADKFFDKNQYSEEELAEIQKQNDDMTVINTMIM